MNNLIVQNRVFSELQPGDTASTTHRTIKAPAERSGPAMPSTTATTIASVAISVTTRVDASADSASGGIAKTASG